MERYLENDLVRRERRVVVSNNKERETLADTFERHADEEGSILQEYRVLAEKLGDGVAGMLVNQILTDEEIHHLLFRTMTSWLRARGAAETTAIPVGTDCEELLRLTKVLQRHERETIESCKALQPQLIGDSAELMNTLLEVMVLDSEKHQRLLAAVEKLLRR
jgi:hypothetical protein